MKLILVMNLLLEVQLRDDLAQKVLFYENKYPDVFGGAIVKFYACFFNNCFLGCNLRNYHVKNIIIRLI